ncbi:hypothetical protein BDW62DRAFT_202613 [Aspergillus aurantiobrunneus]
MAIRQRAQEFSSIISELEVQRSRFKVWAGNLDVFARENASADFRFQHDATATGILEADAECSDSDSSSPSLVLEEESDSESGSETVEKHGEIQDGGLSDVAEIISRLYHFTSIARKTSTSNEPERNYGERVLRFVQNQDPPLDLSELKSHIEWQLGRQCPTLSPGSPLYNRLVEAAIYRRHKILYYQSHQKKLQWGTAEVFDAPQQQQAVDVGRKAAMRDVPIQGFVAGFKADALNDPVPTFIATEATVPNEVSPSTYAKLAVISGVRTSAVGRRGDLDIPPCPRPASGNGTEIQCPYCMLVIEDKLRGKSALREHQWRRHVMKDIDPYVCLFEDCDSDYPFFKKTEEWIDHMQWGHSTRYSCQVPGHEDIFFQTQAGLEQHLAGEHAEQLPSGELSGLVKNGLRPAPDVFAFLAGCLNMGQDRPSQGMEIRQHIASHLERIALLSLPERDDFDAESAARPAPSGIAEGTTDERLDRVSILSLDAVFQTEIGEFLRDRDDPSPANEWPDILGDFTFGGNGDYDPDDDPIIRYFRDWKSSEEKYVPEVQDPGITHCGIQVLYCPLDKTNDCKADVVFVPGVFDTLFLTWRAHESIWPRDLLPNSSFYKDSRILLFTCQHEEFMRQDSNAQTPLPVTCADLLLSHLHKKRRESPGRPIIFIGHSIGGLIVKASLISASSENSPYRQIVDSTKLIVFFATHGGMHRASWRALFRSQFGTHLTNAKLVRDLVQGSDKLNQLLTQFANIARRFRIVSSLETRGTDLVLIVDKMNAVLRVPNEDVQLLDADHQGVWQLTKQDLNWDIVEKVLTKKAEQVVTA